MTKSTNIVESQGFFMNQWAGLPVWSWFVIGGGALIIIALTPVVVIMVLSRETLLSSLQISSQKIYQSVKFL